MQTFVEYAWELTSFEICYILKSALFFKNN
jgi:hypothetical protein